MDGALEFIRPELSILIVFLYCAGLFLKLNREFEKEWTIPYILLLLSFFMTLAYVAIVLGEGVSPAILVAALIQSVLIAAVAVFGNELIKQVMYKRKDQRGEDCCRSCPEDKELKQEGQSQEKETSQDDEKNRKE